MTRPRAHEVLVGQFLSTCNSLIEVRTTERASGDSTTKFVKLVLNTTRDDVLLGSAGLTKLINLLTEARANLDAHVMAALAKRTAELK